MATTNRSSSPSQNRASSPRVIVRVGIGLLWFFLYLATASWWRAIVVLVMLGGAWATVDYYRFRLRRIKDLKRMNRGLPRIDVGKFPKAMWQVWRGKGRRRRTKLRWSWQEPAANHLGTFGAWAAESWRAYQMTMEWQPALHALGIIGKDFWRRVPALRRAKGGTDHDITGGCYPGAVKADLDALRAAAPKLAGYLRHGVEDVRIVKNGEGNVTVHVYFADPLDRHITVESMPRAADDRYMVEGVRRDGTPAVARKDLSGLSAGLTGVGKSNQVHWRIGQLLALGEHLKLYISDAKGGMELPEYSDHVGEWRGRLLVAAYATSETETKAMLQKALKDLRIRQQWLAKPIHGPNRNQRLRKLERPTRDNPRMIIVVDELLLISNLLKGADSEVGQLLSAGRAGLCSMWLATQDGRVEAIPATIRTRIASRQCFATNDPELTNAVLGKNAEAQGARCSEMDPNVDQGLFYSRVDGSGEQFFVKAKAPLVTDAMVAQIADGVVPDEFRRWAAGEGEHVASEDQTLYIVEDPSPEWRRVMGSRKVYVGRTNQPERRFKEHLAGRKRPDWKWCPVHQRRENWWKEHAKVVREVKVQGLLEVKAEERNAIRKHKPVFNYMHNRGSSPVRELRSWFARPVPEGEPALPEVRYDVPEMELDAELAAVEAFANGEPELLEDDGSVDVGLDVLHQEPDPEPDPEPEPDLEPEPERQPELQLAAVAAVADRHAEPDVVPAADPEPAGGAAQWPVLPTEQPRPRATRRAAVRRRPASARRAAAPTTPAPADNSHLTHIGGWGAGE